MTLNAPITAEQETVLAAWQSADHQLHAAKERESAARDALVKAFYPNGYVPKGTNNFDIGQGYVVKIVGKINYTVDGEAANLAVSALRQHSPEGQFIAERLFHWKPDLSVSEYDKIIDKPDLMRLVLPAITSKPGTPSVEIVQPKRK